MGAFVARSEHLKGSRLGGYEIVRLIGHGATASVFEGVHLALGKPVAVKILHEHLASDEQVKNRFLREGRVAARLHHPNTVEVHDVGTEGNVPFLVMELLTGGDLRTLLRDTHLLTLEHALAFLLPIASALAQAHDAGVIHRDLKPANIFLARDVRDDVIPKLVDFGLSKVGGEATTSLTATEMVAGTVLYMAPEQTLGVKHSSPASDQYSLAVILYECITGAAPFTADGVYALIEKIRTEMVRPPSLLNPRLGEPVDDILLRALHRDPSKRFPSIRAFARALLPFASEATARALERDFVDRASGSISVDRIASGSGSVSATHETAAQAETRFEHGEGRDVSPSTPEMDSVRSAARSAFDEKTPSSSAIRASPPLPCPPGKSPFHIKGMPYRGFVHLVTSVVPGGLDTFCASLDDERVSDFIRQPFLAAARYDIFPFLPLSLALARFLGTPFEDFVRRCASAQARYDARTVFRAMWANPTVDAIAVRFPRFMAQYYDFGTFTASAAEPNMLSVVHAGVPAYVNPWYAPMHRAYTEECARMVGATEILSSKQDSVVTGKHEGYALVTSTTEIRWKTG